MEEERSGRIFLDECVGSQVVADLRLPWSQASCVWAWLASPPRLTVARKVNTPQSFD